MGNNMTKQLTVATRRELMDAVARRYHAATRAEKQQILNEVVKVTGFHRKHALRRPKRWTPWASGRDPRLSVRRGDPISLGGDRGGLRPALR